MKFLKLITVVFCVLFFQRTYAQSIQSVTPADTIQTCKSNSFNVLINGGAGIINGTLQINYPLDAVFQNPNGYAISQTAPGQIEITGFTVTAGHSLFLSYELYFPCQMITPQEDPTNPGTFIPFLIDTDEFYLSDNGVQIDSKTDLNYLVRYPNIIGSYTTDPSLTTLSHIDQTFTRVIEFANTGTIDFTGDIRFIDSLSCNAAQITNIKLYIVTNGIATLVPSVQAPFTSLSSTKFKLEHSFSTTPLAVSTPSVPVSFRIEETVKIIACMDNCYNSNQNTVVSNFDLQWGCSFGNIPLPNSFPSTTLNENENLCKSINTFQATIERDNINPLVRVYRVTPNDITPFENICMNAPSSLSNIQPSMYTIREYKYINEGASTAYAINIVLSEFFNSIYTESNDLVFYEDIELTDFNGNDIKSNSINNALPSPIYYSNILYTSPSECVQVAVLAGKNPVTRIPFQIDSILPGEHITLKYKILRCCPQSDDYFNKTKYFDTWSISAFGNSGLFGGGGFSNECTQLSTITNFGATDTINGLYSYFFPRASSIEMVQIDISPPGDMTGGANSTCNYSGTRTFQAITNTFNNPANDAGVEQIFSNSSGTPPLGQLKLIITLDQGLLLNSNSSLGTNLDPSQVIFQDSPTGSLIWASSSSSATPYGGDSSSVEVIFDLSFFPDYSTFQDFMLNSIISFPLTPCCPSYMDGPASYKIDWYLNTSQNTLPCPDCWIPMSRVGNDINIHCPGCVTPGIIVENVSAKRRTFGYLDSDDNGLVDAGINSVMTEADFILPINLSKVMPSDIVRVEASSFFQDGDNSNGGFNYSTWLSHWNTSSQGFQTLNKLYVDIRIPCGDAIASDWSPQNQEIRVFDNDLNTWSNWVDISPYLNRTAEQYYYAIDENALTGSGLIPGYSYNVWDSFEVQIDYKICKNDISFTEDFIDCEITCLMWIAGGASMPNNAFSTMSYAPTENNNLPSGTSAIDRAIALAPATIYNCENFATRIQYYRFFKEYSSKWRNKGVGYLWNQVVCRKKLITSYRLKLGNTNTDYDFFKFEFRPLPSEFINYSFPIPDYYNLQTTDFALNSRVPVYNGSNTLLPGLQIPISSTSPPTSSGGIGNMSYNYSDYVLAKDGMGIPLNNGINNSNNLVLGDEFWNQNLTLFFLPDTTCDTNAEVVGVAVIGSPNTLDASYEINPHLCNTINDTITHPTTYSEYGYDQYLTRPIPNLTLSQPTNQNIQTAEKCFSFTLSNPAGQVAENVYMIISPPPGLTINSFSINGSSSGYSGVIPLNIFQVNTNKNFEICFSIDSCSIGSVQIPIRYGFGCFGYPSTINEQSCWEDTIFVEIIPALVGLNVTTTNQSSSIAPCGQANFEACTNPTEVGNISSLFFTLTMPLDAQLVSGSVTATFNPMSGPIQNLILGSPTISQNSYSFSIDSNIVMTDISDQLCVNFSYESIPGCSSNLGAPPQIEIGGIAYCGDTIAAHPSFNTLTIDTSICPQISTSSNITNESCNNNNGSIDLTIISGVSPFLFDWNNGETTEDIANLSSGIYTVTITDSNLCTTSKSFNVNLSGSSYSISQTASACNSYTWSQNGMTYTTSGTYVDTTMAAGGCDSNVTLNLIINPSYSVLQTASACNSYTWSQNGMTYTTSGTYVDTMMTVAGCDSIITLNLTINSIIITGNITDYCNKPLLGAIDITVSGGNGTYSYSWSGPGGFISNTEDLSNVTGGLYSVIVTDSYGCSNSSSFNVNEFGILTNFNYSQDSNCVYSFNNLTTSNSGTLYEVSWLVDGVNVSNNWNATITFNTSGSHIVCLQVAYELNGLICRDEQCQTINVLCSYIGINENYSLSENIIITPNPSKGKFNLKISIPIGEKYSILIHDNNGKIILKANRKYMIENTFDIKPVAKSIYYIEITTENQHFVKKLLIE